MGPRCRTPNPPPSEGEDNRYSLGRRKRLRRVRVKAPNQPATRDGAGQPDFASS
jgi:hypothetical protein